jgi:hypothetical protein
MGVRGLLVRGVLAVSLGLAVLPAGAEGASLARLRKELRGRHLQPPPLFPSKLPPAFHGAKGTLTHDFDFDVEWDRTVGTENVFAVAFRRGPASWLAQDLNDPATTSARRVRIGSRTVYLLATGHAGAPSLFAWHEQGRTYMLLEKYVGNRTFLRTMSPFVRSLRTLR